MTASQIKFVCIEGRARSQESDSIVNPWWHSTEQTEECTVFFKFTGSSAILKFCAITSYYLLLSCEQYDSFNYECR